MGSLCVRAQPYNQTDIVLTPPHDSPGEKDVLLWHNSLDPAASVDAHARSFLEGMVENGFCTPEVLDTLTS